MARTARIAQLRKSIARNALTAIGIPADAHILDVRRVRDIFIIATENPSDRWASHYVETFRIPTPDDTDPGYGEGRARKIWMPLAGWTGHAADEVPQLMDEAATYVSRYLVAS